MVNLWLPGGKAVREGINWEMETDTYTLPCIKQMTYIRTYYVAQGTLLKTL